MPMEELETLKIALARVARLEEALRVISRASFDAQARTEAITALAGDPGKRD